MRCGCGARQRQLPCEPARHDNSGTKIHTLPTDLDRGVVGGGGERAEREREARRFQPVARQLHSQRSKSELGFLASQEFEFICWFGTSYLCRCSVQSDSKGCCHSSGQAHRCTGFGYRLGRTLTPATTTHFYDESPLQVPGLDLLA